MSQSSSRDRWETRAMEKQITIFNLIIPRRMWVGEYLRVCSLWLRVLSDCDAANEVSQQSNFLSVTFSIFILMPLSVSSGLASSNSSTTSTVNTPTSFDLLWRILRQTLSHIVVEWIRKLSRLLQAVRKKMMTNSFREEKTHFFLVANWIEMVFPLSWYHDSCESRENVVKKLRTEIELFAKLSTATSCEA